MHHHILKNFIHPFPSLSNYILNFPEMSIPREWSTQPLQSMLAHLHFATCLEGCSKQTLTYGPAKNAPSLPTNFRPIALTSCIGKFITSILKDRGSKCMIENEYLDLSIKKASMQATPGCSERKHHLKLAFILSDARKKHKSLAGCGLVGSSQCIW